MNDLRIPLGGATAKPLPATVGVAPSGGPGAASDTTAFHALLERLQALAAPGAPAPEVTTPDDLRAAVRAADSSFHTAMDLRRQLEEAFQRHAS
jgi:hypothetical protein